MNSSKGVNLPNSILVWQTALKEQDSGGRFVPPRPASLGDRCVPSRGADRTPWGQEREWGGRIRVGQGERGQVTIDSHFPKPIPAVSQAEKRLFQELHWRPLFLTFQKNIPAPGSIWPLPRGYISETWEEGERTLTCILTIFITYPRREDGKVWWDQENQEPHRWPAAFPRTNLKKA